MVLSGEKDITWRLWDDKDLQVGDIVILIRRPELVSFGRAELVSIIEKPIGMLTEEDRKGHETFVDNEEMYATYTRYYGKAVGPDTPVKIIKFRLIK